MLAAVAGSTTAQTHDVGAVPQPGHHQAPHVHDVRAHHHSFADSIRCASVTVIDLGTTVRWTAGGNPPHTIRSGRGSTDPMAGNLFEQTLTNTGDTFSFTPAVAGIFPYYCVEHEARGMRGVLIVNPTIPAGESLVHAHHHRFFDAGNGSTETFIRLGESVTFLAGHNAPHTITSGSRQDPASGALFERTLGSGDRLTFTPTVAGRVDYFCREHDVHGMRGTIIVVNPAARPGTHDDVRLDVGINEPVNPLDSSLTTVAAGDAINFRFLSPNSTLEDATPLVLMFNIQPTGEPIPELFPGIYVWAGTLIGPGFLFNKAGTDVSVTAPANIPAGVSVTVQGVVITTTAENGAFAGTQAAELAF